MKTVEITLTCTILVLMLVTACAPGAPAPAPKAAPSSAAVPQAPANAIWEAEWEKTLAAAKKEGRVVIYRQLRSDRAYSH